MANKIIVSQIAARHRYIIPRVLEHRGFLYRLYTDSSRYSFLGRVASFLKMVGIQSISIKRLCGRDPKIDSCKVYSSDILFFKTIIFKLLGKDYLQQQSLIFDGLSDKCMKWGLGKADCVYGMYFENFRFLKYAKSAGLRVVVDIYECPMTYKHLIDEIKNNEELNVFYKYIPKYEKKHKIRMKYIEDLLNLADYYTVPSIQVYKSLKMFSHFDERKVLFLPYASSIIPVKNHWKPEKHRVLFVGSDIVNKGVLYCAKAATILKRKYRDIDFRIVGLSRRDCPPSPVFADLNFIGFIDKTQLEEEYSKAEALVFPTLFEGFAGAVVEAACCGCPIITTENAGTDMNEFPAIYIPEKNVDAIVEAVVSIFEDSRVRDGLSKRVYDYSKRFYPSSFEERLINIIQSV